MVEPNKAILSKSLSGRFSAFSKEWENFSTGSDSPVKLDCEIKQSLVFKNLKSAGIISPAPNLIISPGTMSSVTISINSPSL